MGWGTSVMRRNKLVGVSVQHDTCYWRCDGQAAGQAPYRAIGHSISERRYEYLSKLALLLSEKANSRMSNTPPSCEQPACLPKVELFLGVEEDGNRAERCSPHGEDRMGSVAIKRFSKAGCDALAHPNVKITRRIIPASDTRSTPGAPTKVAIRRPM